MTYETDRERAALTALKFFGSADGEFLLEYLEKTGVTVGIQEGDGIYAALKMAENEGRRDAIRRIRNLIKEGEIL